MRLHVSSLLSPKNFPYFTLEALEAKTDKSAHNVDPDEVAQNRSSHLDLHCLPSSL